jgi:glycosyltransferase involved in cell wall biosynthesis
MRILHVISTFPPAYAFGGPPQAAFRICKELAKRSHYVEVYTTNAYDQRRNFKPSNKQVIIHNIKVTYFSNFIRMSNFYVAPEIIIKLWKTVRQFDIVHIHFGRQLYDAFFSLRENDFYPPYVLEAHGALPYIGRMRRIKLIYDRFFGEKTLKNASKVIALNRIEAEQYKRIGVPEEKIAIIPNGIDLSEYAELPSKGSFKKKFNIPEDRKIILYLGRIHKTKGIDLLIRAYACLKNEMKCKDTILVIVGPDDGYLREARNLANSLGLYNSVMFTGFISRKDKLRALVDADVFITPSFYGFPMTFLESCAVGTPIVTTSLGDTLEWIDGNAGFITQPIARDIAEAIQRIISDDKLRRRFSRNCIEIVKSEFSIEKVVDRLEEVYEEVIKSRIA